MYFALDFYDGPIVSRICVKTLQHAAHINTIKIIQFGLADQMQHSSRDEEANIHTRKRTA